MNIILKILSHIFPVKCVRTKMRMFLAASECILYMENGKGKHLSFRDLKKIRFKNEGAGNHVIINTSLRKLKLEINFAESSENCKVIIGKDVERNFSFNIFEKNTVVEVGDKTTSQSKVWCLLIGNTLKIGKDCMFAGNTCIWGDGHAIFDLSSKKVTNLPKTPILIGDHCWIGSTVNFTKNAQIGDNCVVGVGSIVTKSFKENNCVIAGNPAKVVKENITWDRESPFRFVEKENA